MTDAADTMGSLEEIMQILNRSVISFSTMALIGVGDLWKMFEWAHGREARNRKAIEEWLDAVYTDLSDLSQVWIKISSMAAAVPREDWRQVFAVFRRGADPQSQSVLAGRLEEFYRSASAVLHQQGRVRFGDSFVDHLGRIIMARNGARELLDEQPHFVTLSADLAQHPATDMMSAVDALQKEIVALQALIEEFKARVD